MAVADWQTPEQKEWQRKHDAEHAKLQRMRADALEFYELCPHKCCRRARSCQVDGQPCHPLLIPLIPHDFKIWLRVAVKARMDGLSPEEANKAGEAEVERYQQLEAQYPQLRKIREEEEKRQDAAAERLLRATAREDESTSPLV
jgi:hypothetical protein